MSIFFPFGVLQAVEKKNTTDGNIIFKSRDGHSYYRYNKKIVFKLGTIGDKLIVSRKKGADTLYLQIITPQKDILDVMVKNGVKNEVKDGIKKGVKTGVDREDKEKAKYIVAKKIQLEKGFNEFSVTASFGATNYILLKNKSGAQMVFAEPVLYKRSPGASGKYIFLISVDTLSAKHMGLYGCPRNTTPNIDRFAEDSVTFRNAFANSSWTLSSHMSLFTLRQEHEHGVRMIELDDESHNDTDNDTDDPSSSKQHITIPLSEKIPFLVEGISKRFVTIGFHEGGFLSPIYRFCRGFNQYRQVDRRETQAHPEKLFDSTKKHIRTHQFPAAFYFIHNYYVHMPYIPQERFLNRISSTAGLMKVFDFKKDLGGKTRIFREFSPAVTASVTALYDAEVLGFDFYFGQFIRFLESENIYDNSMIILTADHGEAFYEHGCWGHGSTLYDEQIKIPILVKFPGQKFKGRSIDTPVSLIDILPTVFDYYDMELPMSACNGHSLMPLIQKRAASGGLVVSSIYRCKANQKLPGKVALIKNHFKLIYNEAPLPGTFDYFKPPPPDVPQYELYNLKHDPRELENLYYKHDNPEHDAVKKELTRVLTALLKDMKKTHSTFDNLKGKPMSQKMREQLKSLGYID